MQQERPKGFAKSSVQSFFPTPVVVALAADAERLNAELRAVILSRAEAQESLQHSNLGGWQSSWDIQEWGGPAAQEVFTMARAVADQMTTDREGRPARIAWRMNAWANVNRASHGNEFHTHPGAYWSASYYVDDGGIGDDPSLGGEFEIQDPRGVAPAMYAPLLAFAGPGGRSVGASELISPRSGMIVVFPSWLSHGVRPYQGTGTRISIAMNLSL